MCHQLMYSKSHRCLIKYLRCLVNVAVLPHMRILAHTRMGRPIRVWDIPYVYGTVLCPIHVWASHMGMHA